MCSEAEDTMIRCTGCGLLIRQGSMGCQSLLEEILAKEFNDVSYFSVHRMTVDTYSLQHPESYCVSAKSFASHFTGLCWLLEFWGSRAVGSRKLRLWLDGSPELEKPRMPTIRGKRTIADVRQAKNSEEHARAVELWARSTWDAYAELHPLARLWIREALDRQGPSKSGSKRN